MGNGEDSGTWGTITNTNWNLIEQSVAGVQTITMANANYTLSNLNGVSDEARNMVLNIVGTNSGIYQVVAPLVSKFYIISNNTSGGYAITIGASTGSIITVPNGVTVQVYCDGSTGFFSAQTGSAGNFLVNGNFSCTGNEVDVGNMTIGGTLGVTGATTLSSTLRVTGEVVHNSTTTLSGASTAPTPTAGDNSTNIATTAFVTTAVSNAFPSGTRVLFSQASAPTGWTQDTSDTANNRMIRVVNTTGGGVGGSSDPTINNVVSSHSHTLSAGGTSTVNLDHAHNQQGSFNTGTESASHTHIDAGHNHSLPGVFYSSSPNGFSGAGGAGQTVNATGTGYANLGTETATHYHGVSISGATTAMSANANHSHTLTGSTDGNASAANWTPRYNNVIICQKN